RSVAPAHAAADVRAAATDAVGGSYQAGLADGVALVLGHRPGSCPVCAPQVTGDASALIGALSVREAGGRGVPARLAQLALAAAAPGRAR
ncbi:MAG TPA: hypothetical protein VHK88_10745, partial [Aquihabitans sp.]|nr:hypothetical protein [Aquihabitans sp.]